MMRLQPAEMSLNCQSGEVARLTAHDGCKCARLHRLLRGPEEGEAEMGPETLQLLRARVDAFVADPSAQLAAKLDSLAVVQAGALPHCPQRSSGSMLPLPVVSEPASSTALRAAGLAPTYSRGQL